MGGDRALAMECLRDRLAVVTGAAGGLGAALATHLAELGCTLAVCDLDAAGLERTRSACERSGVRASGRVLDVSDAAQVFDWAKAVVDQHGSPHLVFNNAGATLVA